MKDAKHWDWGIGTCNKHLGQSLPCLTCVEAGDFFDDAIIKARMVGTTPNIQNISKKSIAEAIANKEADYSQYQQKVIDLFGAMTPQEYNDVRRQFVEQNLGKSNSCVVDESFIPRNPKNPCGEIALTKPSPEMVARQKAFDAQSRVAAKNRKFAELYGVPASELEPTSEEVKKALEVLNLHYTKILASRREGNLTPTQLSIFETFQIKDKNVKE